MSKFEKGNQVAKKWTEDKLKELCQELISFSKEPDTFHIIEFCNRKDKVHGWLLDLRDRYPVVSEAYKKVQQNLGSKIFKGGMTNELNQLFSSRYIGYYLDDLKEYEREQKEWELRTKTTIEREKDEHYGSKIDELTKAINEMTPKKK